MRAPSLTRNLVISAALALLLPLTAHAQVSDWCDTAPALPLNRVTMLWLDGGVLLADGGVSTLTTNAAQLTTDGGAAACFSNFSTVSNTFSAAIGRDTAWSFTPTSTGTYSFRTGVPTASVNTVLYLTSSCQPLSYAYGAGECVAAVNHTSGVGQEELSCVPMVAGTPMFLWVDEATLSAVGSNLTLELAACFAETEPNDDPGTAGPLACAVTGGIRTAGEADFFALGTLPAGTRVFSLVEAAAANLNDFDLRVTTATRTLEYDNNNAAAFFGDGSGLVAGTPLPAEASFLRVSYAAAATRAEPYVLYSKVELGAPTPETEPNDSVAQANGNASQYFTGFVGDAGDVDFFAVQANAGDVIFAALDSVPDRSDAGTTSTNLNFNLTLTDADGGTLLAVDDGSNNTFNFTQAASGLDAGTPFGPAEALVWRARVTGTYGLRVAKSSTVPSAYLLSVSVGCTNTAPTVSAVTPATGPVAGGTTVTLTGTGFGQNAQVFIGGKRAPRVSGTDTQLVVVTPGQALEGPQTLVVTDGLGRPATSDVFTYADPAGVGPTLASVTPNHAPVDGGTTVTVTGSVFRDGVAVFFAGAPAPAVTRVSTTQLNVVTPPGAAGPADVRVLNPDALEATLPASLTYDGPPTVSAVTPNTGTSLGGDTVTLTGTNFRAGTRVFFGAREAQVVSINSDTSLTVLSPYTTVDGPYDVTAVDTWGQQGTLTAGFTYGFAAPSLTGIAPGRGLSSGGTTVTLTGSGLRDGAQVNFIVASVPVAATTVSVRDGGTSLTAVTPAQAVGLADVQVVNTDLQAATLPAAYRFDGPPVITTVAPATGLTTGGTTVTLTGGEFRRDAGVWFGATAATAITVATDGLSLTANTPATSLAGPVAVRVRNTDTQETILDGGYTYVYPAPTLTAVSPTHGYASGNTLLTLTGTGFLSTPQTSGPPAVTVGGIAATSVTRVSATTVTARTPANPAGPADVVITNGDGQSATLTQSFTYDPSPLFISVSPTRGPAQGGTRITVTGANFQAGAAVSVGGVPAFAVTVSSATTLSATTIAQAAGVWPVSVTNPDGQTVTSATAVFTVDEAPAIAAVAPLAGVKEGGTLVTLTGSGFQTGAQVLFGALDGTNVTVGSSTSLTVTAPAHAVGLVPVTVRNPDGQVVTVNRAYQYVEAPTLLSLSPAAGDVAGGESVHLLGAGFASGATVAFGGVAATDVTFLTSGELLAVAPPHEPGAVDVTVFTQGLTLTLSGAYTYSRGQPVINALSPVAGPTAGGTLLSIVGTGFLPGATVSLGGTPITPVTVVSGTLLRVTTPAHAEGAVDISVSNPDGQSGALASAFTYADAMAPSDDTLRDGGSGTLGVAPDYTPTPGGVSCGCSSFDGAAFNFAALGVLALLARRRRSRADD